MDYFTILNRNKIALEFGNRSILFFKDKNNGHAGQRNTGGRESIEKLNEPVFHLSVTHISEIKI
ncbi:MAG TPA: hypothetical protein VFF23_08415 [Hanamia sp.]|nr:hypothetical protein [Hanamia sp.]